MTAYGFEVGRTHLLRLPTGSDILIEIARFAETQGIEAGWLGYLGAVRRAALRYYDQDALEYRDFVIDRHLEVLSGVGNISLLEGRPFVHTHAVFGDDRGRAFGGHLAEGCEVWSLEVRIDELHGERLERFLDEDTGLAVWR